MLIAVCSGLAGVVVAGIMNIIVSVIQNKNENIRAIIDLRVDVYADAIRYIDILAKIKSLEKQDGDLDECKRAMQEEHELLNRFYPLLSIIVNNKKIEEYNNLIKEVDTGKISRDKALFKAVKVLNFRINDK